MSVKYASGRTLASAPLVSTAAYPPTLDATALRGSWVIAPDGTMIYSDGSEWYANEPQGSEVLIPPWVPVPDGWFEINIDLDGVLSNRNLISNKFNINYVLSDAETWPIVTPSAMYFDSAGTMPVLTAPESVGLLESSVTPQINWFQDVTIDRPKWVELTRTIGGVEKTLDAISFDGLGQHFKVDFPTTVNGSMVHFTSAGPYIIGVEIPAGVYEFGRYHDWADLEELVVLNRFLTSGEASGLISELGKQRDRLTELSLPTNLSSAFRNRTEIISIQTFDSTGVTNFASTFSGCSSLTSFPEIDTSSGTNFASTFSGCSSLTSFPEIDTSSGTDFTRTWFSCSSLTSFPEIDISSVSSAVMADGSGLEGAWENCTGLKSFPLIDLHGVKNLRRAWKNCSGLISFPTLDTSQVTNFGFRGGGGNGGAWEGCSGLTSFPELDTQNLRRARDAWRNCSGLASFPELDLSKVNDLEAAWADCSSLTSFPELDISSATNIKNAWSGCSSLTSFPVLNTSSVTEEVGSFGSGYSNGAWSRCSSLTSFPFLDLSGVKRTSYTKRGGFAYAWANCTSLSDFPAGFFDNIENNSYFEAFFNCALSQSSVDRILVSISSASNTFQLDASTNKAGRIDINGGTNSTPSATGQTAADALRARGWIVNLNGY